MQLSNQDRQHYGNKTPDSYNGIPIFAAKNLHEKIFEVFTSYNPKKNDKILILGAGGGALDQRLIDFGYSDITSVDYISEDYHVKGTRFIQSDLNLNFSNLGNFDYIFAIEIIEHIENPFHFIREIKCLLNKNGKLFLSTPNILSKFSRIRSLFSNDFFYFSDYALNNSGHITPILTHILEYNLSMSGLKKINMFTNLNWGDIIWKQSFIKGVLYSLVTYFISGSDSDINISIVTHDNV